MSDAITKVNFAGIPVNIENPAGTVRTGTDATGKPWQTAMVHSYGYIPKATGGDGEGLDAYLGPKEDAPEAHIVHQNNVDGGYDEDKAMLGFPTQMDAKTSYLAHTGNDPKKIRSITTMPMDNFKSMLTKAEPGSVHWKKKHGRNHATTALFSREIELGMNSSVHSRAMAAIKAGKISHGDWSAPDATADNAMLHVPENKGNKDEYKYPIFTSGGDLSAKGVGSALAYAEKNNESAIVGPLKSISDAIKAHETTTMCRVELEGLSFEVPITAKEIVQMARARLARCPGCKSYDITRLDSASSNEGPMDSCDRCGRKFPHKVGSVTASMHEMARQDGYDEGPFPNTPGTTEQAGWTETDPPVEKPDGTDVEDDEEGLDDDDQEMLANMPVMASRYGKKLFSKV
jgi:hypothetical protein